MGIPSYFIHIVQNHRDIIKNYEKNKMITDNLYLDCNSLIYDSYNILQDQQDKPDFENKIINEVCRKIIEHINNIKPLKKLMIAFDGVAPVAKLSQQKTRRYKSWFQNKLLGDLLGEDTENINKWNTSAITPGTKFMNILGEKIDEQFSNPNEFNLNKIIISNSSVPGEGEHKIFQYIRNNHEYHKNTTTVIYGLDADLIMLVLNHLYISKKIYLYRETPHFINNIDKTLDPNKIYLMDIPEFSMILSRELNNGKNPTTAQEKYRIFDYILLCFFLGNDFLPHFPALNIRTNGIDRLITAYKQEISSKNLNLTDGKNIIWKNMRKLVSILAESEHEYIKEEYYNRNKFKQHKQRENIKNEDIEKKQIENDLLLIPMRERCVEKYINPLESGWQKRYYSILFDLKINDDRKREISINYLEGLEWTMNYYTSGCIDWRWKYKYHYPPLLSDLVKFIPYFDTQLITQKIARPLHSIVQLSYVLPRSSLTLLPYNIHKLLINKYPEWYKNTYEFEWSFCKYFWEAHAKMPEVNIEELEKTLSDYIY